MDRASSNGMTGLGRRKKDLERRLRELAGPSHQLELLQVEAFADPVDQVVSNADREIVGQRLNNEAHWIKDIRSALDKIQDGDYGQCETCDEPIGLKRLDAIPWARLCVTCQSAAEAHGGIHNVAFDRAA
jgi:DnaK suppressor protein